MQENASEELRTLQIRALDEEAATLSQKFMALWDIDKIEREKALERYATIGLSSILGQTPHISTVTARLSQIRQSLEEARFGRWPVAYFALDNDGTEIMDATGWDGLLHIAKQTIATCEQIYEYMMSTESSKKSLRELQTPELTELLDAIRQSKK